MSFLFFLEELLDILMTECMSKWNEIFFFSDTIIEKNNV